MDEDGHLRIHWIPFAQSTAIPITIPQIFIYKQVIIYKSTVTTTFASSRNFHLQTSDYLKPTVTTTFASCRNFFLVFRNSLPTLMIWLIDVLIELLVFHWKGH